MCTSIRIKSISGELFWGRTMDLNLPLFPNKSGNYLPCVITSIPQNIQIESQLSPWESKHSVIGIGIKDTPILFDGVNEYGLAGDLQVLMECGWAEKEMIEKSHKTPIIAEEFVSYMLTNFKSVSEIRENIGNYVLINQPYIYGKTAFHFPVHFSFIDESEDSIVIETTENGDFVIFEHIGVMTNSPRYDYHQTNIRNYTRISEINIRDKKVFPNSTELTPIEGGTGYGMYGIPGDYTSPSRFVRAFLLSALLNPFEKEKGFNELYSVFRTVIIPQGLEREQSNTDVSDFTRYWSGYDISQRKIIIQSGQGLAFTTKSLDKKLSHISHDEINISI